MSTLSEVEAAADTLSLEQQAQLLDYLARRLRQSNRTPVASIAHSRSSRRGFPISKGRASFTSEDVARMESDPAA
ncbi:MAG TPA: hypothetical protein VIM48_02140 [Chthoniobacterales bacterium]